MARTISPEEFEELFRAVAPELAGYVGRQGVADVEDLVADVFATAWRRRTDLPPPVLRRAWLFGTARRLLLASTRRSHAERAAVVDLARAVDEDGGAAPLERDEGVVLRALGRLTEAERELIQLTEWERLTPAEIAVALGVRAGTVRVRLHRARRALAADPEMQALMPVDRGRTVGGPAYNRTHDRDSGAGEEGGRGRPLGHRPARSRS